MVQSWVPNDGLDSDDPDCGGGDDGDLSSGSDWYDDAKDETSWQAADKGWVILTS